MSTAFFIVLDDDDPGFDAFVDGKILTKHVERVNEIASQLGLKTFDEYAFQDLSEFGGPEMDVEWFDANEGIRWASALLEHIEANPDSVNESAAVCQDLADYVRVFTEAATRHCRWHLEMDI